MPSQPLAVLADRHGLATGVVQLLRDCALDRKMVRRLTALDRYTSEDEAHGVPLSLIAPTTRAAFRTLDQDARRGLIVDRVRAETRANKQRQRVRSRARAALRREGAHAPTESAPYPTGALAPAPRPATTPTTPPAPGPVPAARVVGAVVFCACGCSEVFPARGSRALLRYCETSAAARRRQT